MSALGRRIARSRLAPIAAFPTRVRTVGRYDARVLRASARWLWHSREHTNFTYNLTTLNRDQLAWWISEIAEVPVQEVRGYMSELDADEAFAEHVAAATRVSDRRRLADPVPRPGRRVGWYALVRCLRPQHVVETGTDKGLGSCVLAAALLRNGKGQLTTVDVNPDAGFLIKPPYSNVTDLRVDESITVLREVAVPVGLFLQDSWSTFEHERNELEAMAPHLEQRAVVLNGRTGTRSLAEWAERTGRRYLYFHAQPDDHWYPGDGIGAAWFARSASERGEVGSEAAPG
jgi:hypothetical protein